jgi:hypothetical protein
MPPAKKIDVLESEAAARPDGLPDAVQSQQSQALGKARVDTGAIATAAEGGAKHESDDTVYPGSAKQGATAPTETSGGASAQAAPPQGSPQTGGIVPSAVQSQQSQALGKARVDPNAMAAAAQGAITTIGAAASPMREGEKAQVAATSDAVSSGMALAQVPSTRAQRTAPASQRSLLDEYLDQVVRAATAPLPPVPASNTAKLDTAADAAIGPEDMLAVEGGWRAEAAEEAMPPPGAVALLSLQGPRITNPAAQPAHAPADASAAAAAGSLGIARHRVTSDAGNHVVLEGAATRSMALGQALVDRAHAGAMAGEWNERATIETRRARDLSEEAARLRSEAATRREGGAVTSAAALEERVRVLQAAAGRHELTASRAVEAERKWRRRAEGLPGTAVRVNEGAAGDLVREAAAGSTHLVPTRRDKTPRRRRRRCMRPEGGAGWQSR